jgi:hypothetical protein
VASGSVGNGVGGVDNVRCRDLARRVKSGTSPTSCSSAATGGGLGYFVCVHNHFTTLHSDCLQGYCNLL